MAKVLYLTNSIGARFENPSQNHIVEAMSAHSSWVYQNRKMCFDAGTSGVAKLPSRKQMEIPKVLFTLLALFTF